MASKLKENSSLFLKFLSLGNLFKKYNKSEIDNFEESAQLLLDTKNYDAFFDMILEGYTPPPPQRKIFDNFITRLLCSDVTGYTMRKDFLELEQLVEKGLSLSTKQVIRFMAKSNGLLSLNPKCLKNSQEEFFLSLGSEKAVLKNFILEVRTKISQPDFSNLLFEQFKHELYKGFKYNKPDVSDVVSKYIIILKEYPELIFKDVPFEEYMKINKYANENRMYASQSEVFQNITKNLYGNNIKKIISNTRNQYAGKFIENLTLDKLKNEPHSINELPKDALTVIDSIDELYAKIKANKDLGVEDTHAIDLLLEKRVPEVLSKYLKVDVTYRKTLFDMNGKNAEELMLESLRNIHASFLDIFERSNKEQLHNLTTMHAYTKAIKPNKN